MQKHIFTEYFYQMLTHRVWVLINKLVQNNDNIQKRILQHVQYIEDNFEIQFGVDSIM